MATVIKILLITFVLYFIFSWVKNLIIQPQKQKVNRDSNIRIFKKGDVETAKVDIKDAETVEFEEIENP